MQSNLGSSKQNGSYTSEISNHRFGPECEMVHIINLYIAINYSNTSTGRTNLCGPFEFELQWLYCNKSTKMKSEF